MNTKCLRIAAFMAASLFAARLFAQDDTFNRDFGIGGGVQPVARRVSRTVEEHSLGWPA